MRLTSSGTAYICSMYTVNGSFVFSQKPGRSAGRLASHLWIGFFNVIELNVNMRQQDDIYLHVHVLCIHSIFMYPDGMVLLLNAIKLILFRK